MPKHKLDKSFILTAHCPVGKKKVDYWDTHVNGFVLETRQSGGKTYYIRYLDQHGRQRQHKIGKVEDLSFDKAKKEAQRLRSEVTLGGDPADKKAEKKTVPAYAQLAQQHLDHAKTYQRSYDTTEMYIRNHIIPRWGKLRLTEIHQQDIAKWLAQKGEEGLAPATVEKIRTIFGRSFELALQWDIPGLLKNPVRGIPRKPINNARERFLTAAEARRLIEATFLSQNPSLPAIVQMLLFTGARVSELLNAEWKHVNLESRSWLIPTSKTGKSRHVPLSQAAIDVLTDVPRIEKCGYVFPNPATLKPFTGIKHGWQKARERAGLHDLRVHDLRHSAASFMINGGVDLFTVGKVLGHASYASTMRYSHVANATLMAAVEAGSKGMVATSA